MRRILKLEMQWPEILITGFLSSILGLYLAIAWSNPVPKLVVTIRSVVSATGQVFYDLGAGFREEQSQRFAIQASPEPRHYEIQLPAGLIRGLRLDPMDVAGNFSITAIELITSGGRIEVAPSSLQLAHDLRLGDNSFEFIATGDDPFAYIPLASPLNTALIDKLNWPSFLIFFLAIMFLLHAVPYKLIEKTRKNYRVSIGLVLAISTFTAIITTWSKFMLVADSPSYIGYLSSPGIPGFRAPLLPIVLHLLDDNVQRLIIMQIILTVTVPLLIYLAARELLASRALYIGIGAALFPQWFAFANLVLTEALSTALAGGLLCSVCVYLCRPTRGVLFLVFASAVALELAHTRFVLATVPLAIALFAATPVGFPRRAFREGVAAALIAPLIALAVQGFINYRISGDFTPVRTYGLVTHAFGIILRNPQKSDPCKVESPAAIAMCNVMRRYPHETPTGLAAYGIHEYMRIEKSSMLAASQALQAFSIDMIAHHIGDYFGNMLRSIRWYFWSQPWMASAYLNAAGRSRGESAATIKVVGKIIPLSAVDRFFKKIVVSFAAISSLCALVILHSRKKQQAPVYAIWVFMVLFCLYDLAVTCIFSHAFPGETARYWVALSPFYFMLVAIPSAIGSASAFSESAADQQFPRRRASSVMT